MADFKVSKGQIQTLLYSGWTTDSSGFFYHEKYKNGKTGLSPSRALMRTGHCFQHTLIEDTGAKFHSIKRNISKPTSERSKEQIKELVNRLHAVQYA